MRPITLLLLDAEVEAHSLYTADITRTLPVSGRFSREQRQIVFITAALERTDGPQSIATVETERTKRIGAGEFFQA